MKSVHEHMWDYLKAIRNPVHLQKWLEIANQLLLKNGFEKQSNPLEAQRLLKKINKYYLFV